MGLLFNYIFARNPGPLSILDKSTHGQAYIDFRESSAEALLSSARKEFTMTSSEGQKLKGYYYPASSEPSGTIALIVHGYRSNHAETAGMFKDMYHSRGIDIFAIDLPAHGDSEGEYISFGYYESESLLQWIDFLIMYFGDKTEIILHGFSMGGCTVLSVSDRVPNNVRFIIDDCGMSSAKEILVPKLGSLYPVINIICLIKSKLHFSLSMSDARKHISDAVCPILFVHGDKDPTVPFSMGKSLYGSCKSAKDKLWVEGALHMECKFLSPEEYGKKLDEFIDYYC